MTSLFTPEGIVYGDGHHLPDARALQELSPDIWRANAFKTSYAVAALPDHPQSVVRIEAPPMNICNPWGFTALVRQGIAHFDLLGKAGVHIPAQRFVIGPDFHGRKHQTLYVFAEKLAGRPLTSRPADAPYTSALIGSLASYLTDIHTNNEQALMSDIFSAGQYAAQDDNKTALYDVGLRFDKLRQGSQRSKRLYSFALELDQWAMDTDIRTPEPLQQLLGQVENKLLRGARRYIYKHAIARQERQLRAQIQNTNKTMI
jgi:hypothetical protein